MKKKYQGGLSSILVCTWKVILGNKGEGVGNDREERVKANRVCINVLFTTVGNWLSKLWGHSEEPHRVCLRIVPL